MRVSDRERERERGKGVSEGEREREREREKERERGVWSFTFPGTARGWLRCLRDRRNSSLFKLQALSWPQR